MLTSILTNPVLPSFPPTHRSKSRRAELGPDECKPVNISLLINRFDAQRAEAEESVSIPDMKELLGLPLLGVIPESKHILPCTNLGNPVITLSGEDVPAGLAFGDTVDRYLGEQKDLRFVTPEKKSFIQQLFGG